jgi:hypothetical protein
VKLILRIFLAALIGFVIALGFSFLFLNLLDRAGTDQLLLLFFSTAAFGYLIFSFLDMPRDVLQRSLKLSFQFDSITHFVREHWAGIALALLFFSAYFYVGLKLNPAQMDTVDNYLDADNSSWMRRIAAPQGSGLEMRGPHPFAYLIFRPFGYFLNIFTGNFALSAILLNTLAGALCVFLAWFYFKRHTQNTFYALLIASLLGLNTSHFFFGSVVETYIFSALFLILFFVLLQKNETSIGSLAAVSLITFGITLTNYVQTFIGFLVSHPRIKEVIRFVGFTLSLGIIFSLIQAAMYPSSKLFFLLSDAQAEGEFTFSIFQEPLWRGLGRLQLLIRTFFLYTVVAPRPYVFTTEVGGTFPRFNFFKIAPETFSYSSYDGLGTVVIVAWIILFFSASLLFMIELLRTRKIDVRVSLLLCVLFNFILHLYYGYEPFLYSPDWAYALIFFVGCSLSRFAENKLFQMGMLAFVLCLAVNQWQFFNFIFNTIAPFVEK